MQYPKPRKIDNLILKAANHGSVFGDTPRLSFSKDLHGRLHLEHNEMVEPHRLQVQIVRHSVPWVTWDEAPVPIGHGYSAINSAQQVFILKSEPGEEVSNKAHGVKHKAGKWRGSYVLQCKRLEGWRYLRVLDTRTLLTDSKIKRMNMEGGLLTRLWDVHISIPIGLFH